MKTHNNSFTTVRHLKRFNDIRKIRADVFALKQLSTLSFLLDTKSTANQITEAMNQIGLRTATGLPWSSKSLRRLRKRLDSLLRGVHPKRPHLLATTYTSDEVEQLEFMRTTRLFALNSREGDFSNMNDRMCLLELERDY